MKTIKLVTVGKLKKSFWKEAAGHYRKSLKKFCSLEQIVLKDGPAHLPENERMDKETEAILARIGPRDLVVCLDEKGRSLKSNVLATRVRTWIEDPVQIPCFVIGGAFGLGEPVRQRAELVMSFGPMTLTHELAQVVLLEQLYRSFTILYGLPYHH